MLAGRLSEPAAAGREPESFRKIPRLLMDTPPGVNLGPGSSERVTGRRAVLSPHRPVGTLVRRRHLEHALDQIAMVLVTDAKGNYLSVNDKFVQISKYSREEVIGHSTRLANSGLHDNEFFANLWTTVTQGHVWRGEMRNRAKDGQFYWVDSTILPILNENDEPVEYLAIHIDITERKRAAAKFLEQATLLRLGEMATAVAHEVRNPLAGIAGALQVIAPRLPEGSEERVVMQDILTRIDELASTLTNVLEYARPRNPRVGPVDIRAHLGELQRTLEDDPRLDGIELRVQGDPVICNVDPRMLRGALLNLVINAAQATSGFGLIELSVAEVDEMCRIQVRDHGSGIPEANRERVFNAFFTTKSAGTGLGLTIARQAVEHHGGRLEVSCPPDGGTCVTIDLPLPGR